MVRIPDKIRSRLKKPLGALHQDFSGLKKLSKTRRIISVGDVCTLGLLAMGIRPHLAVFDYRLMRQKLDPGMINILRFHFKNPRRYKNPPGTVSEEILAQARELIEKGGAVLIEGEEDLTALAFIVNASKKEIIVYGQPGEGMVVVEPDKKLKKKIERWLAAVTLGHEVERDKGE
jgi:uncharacterized protein (UPF0218 family)